jgi:hypothetical protein
MYASAGAYTGGFYALDKAWYKSGKSKFHFFNDNAGWLQVDKIGHAFSAYHISRYCYALMKNSGYDERKSAFLSVLTGGILMLPIEIFDGFSPDYGASAGDALANLSGSALFGLQQIFWREQRIMLKFFYRESIFPQMRPNIFGKNLPEKILKDYNGQTLWLTFDGAKFFKNAPRICRYVHLSFGYAGRNMLYANAEKSAENGFIQERAFFLSLDLALQNVPTRKKWLRTLLDFTSTVKIPAPALGFSKGNFFVGLQ